MFPACVLGCSFVVLFLFLFTFLSVQSLANQQEAFPDITLTTPTPTVTPTPTPSSPVFTATMHVVPDKTILEINETVNVRVSIDVSEGCRYPIYKLKLMQEGEEIPPFVYILPITHTVGPAGVSNPFTYTLQAVRLGAIRFKGLAYGERYCGDYWNWTYVTGVSDVVTIVDYNRQMYLPLIHYDCCLPAGTE